MGTRLFERLPTGWTPTPAGARLVAAATRFDEELIAAERAIIGRDAQLFGELRVSVPYLFGEHLLMPHLVAFAAAHPGIELQVVASMQRASLSRREADVAIRITNHPPEAAIGRRVGRLAWGVYVSRELYQRAIQSNTAPAFIGLDDGAPIPAAYARCFPAARLGARMNDPLLVLEAVRCGLGAGILARCIGERDATLQHLVGVPEASVDMWLLCHADLRTTARVRAFMDCMYEGLTGALRRDE